MVPAPLPQELIDYIIDIIALPPDGVDEWYTARPRTQRRALASCTLVCRDWLPRSSHYLLDRIVISVVIMDSPDILRKTIRASPRLSKDVRTLIVTTSSLADSRSFQVGSTPGEANIFDMLQYLPRIKNVSIAECAYFKSSATVQPAPHSRATLSKIYLRSTSASTVASCLSLCPEVDRIDIVDVSCHYHWHPSDPTPASRLPIKHLSMKNIRGRLNFIGAMISPECLESLELEHVAYTTPGELNPFLLDFGRNITYLKLNLGSLRSEGGHTPILVPPLSSFPKLETLDIGNGHGHSLLLHISTLRLWMKPAVPQTLRHVRLLVPYICVVRDVADAVGFDTAAADLSTILARCMNLRTLKVALALSPYNIPGNGGNDIRNLKALMDEEYEGRFQYVGLRLNGMTEFSLA